MGKRIFAIVFLLILTAVGRVWAGCGRSWLEFLQRSG